MNAGLKIGSLFAGIGGLELGLERAGVGRTVWQVEIDPYCRAILAKHWPDARRYTDVRRVHGKAHCPNNKYNEAPWPCEWCITDRPDVICGGFPCQDISYAGSGRGLAGERSGLWFEFARIVREVRPRFVVVENVAALLTRGLGDVLGTLADCGYDAEWSCVQALDVGAPHIRDRLFIVAYAPGDLRRAPGDARHEALDGRGAGLDDTHGRGCREPALVSQLPPRAKTVSAGEGFAGQHWDSEPGMGRVVDGVPVELVTANLKALGNAVVPQVAEVVGRRLLQIHEELEAGAR